MFHKLYVLMIISLSLQTAIAAEQRTDIKFAAMPEAARYTVSHLIDTHTIGQITRVTEDGYSKFEIKSTRKVDKKNMVAIDMTVASDGEIMTLAKEVPAYSIPFPAMKKVNQRYPDLKADEVKIVQTRYFLLTGKSAGQPVQLRIYDDGNIEPIGATESTATKPQTAAPGKPNPLQKAPATPPVDEDFDKIIPDQATEPPLEPSEGGLLPDQP